MKADVAVIGGGLSGLAAAVDLSLKGRIVTLIEHAPKLGGRCYSYTDEATGDVVDNGQHVLVGAYRHTLRYLQLIGTTKFLKRSPGLSLLMHHPKLGFSRLEVGALPRPLHLTSALLRYKHLTLNERRSLLRVGLALARRSTREEELLSTLTIDQWLTRLGQSEEARRSLWYPIAVSVMNELPERASALLLARTLRATFLGPKSDSALLIPTVGQTELYVTPAAELLERNGSTVLLNAEVQSLHTRGGKINHIELKDGRSIEPSAVIAAVPHYRLVKLLPKEMSDGGLKERIRQIPSSPIVSIHLWFDKHFMEDESVGVIGKTLQWIFNRRMIFGETDSPTSYISAIVSAAHDSINTSRTELLNVALRDLASIYPESRSARLVHSVVIKERRATFSSTNASEALRPGTATSVKNLFLAGDWTNTGLPGTIEGAILSGFAASTHAQRLTASQEGQGRRGASNG